MTVLLSLPEVQFFTEDDAYHYSVENRPLTNLEARDQVLANAIDQRSITYQVIIPSTGFNKIIEPTSMNFIQIIAPISNLANGSFTMPVSPVESQVVKVISTKNITNLIVSPSAGQTIDGTPTTLTSTSSFEYIYVSSLLTWFRTK